MPGHPTAAERKFHLEYGRQKLAQMRNEGILRVEISSSRDDQVCEECALLDSKVFDIDRAPLLPIHEERTIFITDDEEREIEEAIPICRCAYLAASE
ncbi:MAG TPA: hypothetical protein VLC46_21565 [Thermoanaerobaculia bacterium]|jgi:hypothetical protein|nr:hypothetical protein [Thermoanaerobaculia bacterium]